MNKRSIYILNKKAEKSLRCFIGLVTAQNVEVPRAKVVANYVNNYPLSGLHAGTICT